MGICLSNRPTRERKKGYSEDLYRSASTLIYESSSLLRNCLGIIRNYRNKSIPRFILIAAFHDPFLSYSFLLEHSISKSLFTTVHSIPPIERFHETTSRRIKYSLRYAGGSLTPTLPNSLHSSSLRNKCEIGQPVSRSVVHQFSSSIQ